MALRHEAYGICSGAASFRRYHGSAYLPDDAADVEIDAEANTTADVRPPVCADMGIARSPQDLDHVVRRQRRCRGSDHDRVDARPLLLRPACELLGEFDALSVFLVGAGSRLGIEQHAIVAAAGRRTGAGTDGIIMPTVCLDGRPLFATAAGEECDERDARKDKHVVDPGP